MNNLKLSIEQLSGDIFMVAEYYTAMEVIKL